MEIIIGVTGSTGTILAVRLLEALKEQEGVNTHLIMSRWAGENLAIETDYTLEYMHSLATKVYDNDNLGAGISSGSFLTDGMIILPCSMKTLSSVANGFCDNLIARTADVMLKEGRKLVICPRETPLNAIHLENMLKLARLGVRMVPPMPAFYNRPQTIDDLVNHHVMKVLDQFGLRYSRGKRWEGQ